MKIDTILTASAREQECMAECICRAIEAALALAKVVDGVAEVGAADMRRLCDDAVGEILNELDIDRRER